MTVAMAAPTTPMCRPKMKTGSSTVLITAPKIMHFMVYLGLPSARIMAVRAELKSRKGSPQTMIRV